jgi:hypothetical protein
VQLVTFDDVGTGTDISTHYAGLTFSCDGAKCLAPGIFAWKTSTPKSTPNTVAPYQGGAGNNPGVSNRLVGRIKIELSSPASAVTVEARAFPVPGMVGTPEHAVLIAEDQAGTVVGRAVGMMLNAWESLTVSASGNTIARVFLDVDSTVPPGAESVAQFDDLRIEWTPNVRAWWFPDRATRMWVLFGMVALVAATLVVRARFRA